MKKANIKTTTYETGFENFMIDITETDEEYGAYIYRSDCGLKNFIYGVLKSTTTLREFKEMLENTMTEDMYFYDKDVEDIEAMHTQQLMEGRTS